MPAPTIKIHAPKPAPLVILTHEFYPHRGGIAVFVAEMARAAQTLGYAVEVWAPALPAGKSEPSWDFQVKRLPLAGDHSLRSQWRMARAVWAHRDTLRQATLYIAEPGPLLAMLVLQYSPGLQPGRLFVTLYGSEIHRLASRGLLRWSTGHFLTKTTQISLISRFGHNLFNQYFPAHAAKVVLTLGALRTDLAPKNSAPQPKPPSEKVIILTVARLNPRKGQLQVISALRALRPDQRANLEYWLVGSHSKEGYDEQLQSAANEADFPVKFLGSVPDDQLDSVYAQADIFAMTSMPHKHSVEGFGLVYLEAGVHGLPVIAHDIGGVPDAVIDGVTGLLVPTGDVAALTAAFAKLIDDPALRQKMGAAGRTHALAHTWEKSAHALFGDPPTLS